MDGVATALVSTLTNGGNGAIVALLIFICYGLWGERARLIREHDAAQVRLDAVAKAQLDSAASIVAAVNRVSETVAGLRRRD